MIWTVTVTVAVARGGVMPSATGPVRAAGAAVVAVAAATAVVTGEVGAHRRRPHRWAMGSLPTAMDSHRPTGMVTPGSRQWVTHQQATRCLATLCQLGTVSRSSRCLVVPIHRRSRVATSSRCKMVRPTSRATGSPCPATSKPRSLRATRSSHRRASSHLPGSSHRRRAIRLQQVSRLGIRPLLATRLSQATRHPLRGIKRRPAGIKHCRQDTRPLPTDSQRHKGYL
mmetsp:Transcript_84992/g.218927  ORF Transcript_84992/g.218927 Transcript_84992/m.218927 type:complete len:227 (+) Transcript_84992:560-1240(+)